VVFALLEVVESRYTLGLTQVSMQLARGQAGEAQQDGHTVALLLCLKENDDFLGVLFDFSYYAYQGSLSSRLI
jgi:hypothetical protein